MVAPRHVAVDEVLRRIGGQLGILAVRRARKEENVSPELGRFHDEAVHRELSRLIRRPRDERFSAIRCRRAELNAERASLGRLSEAIREKEDARAAVAAATAPFESWADRIAAEERSAREILGSREKELASLEGRLIRTRGDAEASSERYEEQWVASGILARLGTLFGIGSLAALRRDRGTFTKSVSRLEADRLRALAARDEAQSVLAAVREEDRRERPRLEGELEAATARLRGAEDRWLEASRSVPEGGRLSSEVVARSIQECDENVASIERDIRLEDIWFECAGMDPLGTFEQAEAVAQEIGRELVESANLVAATTVAIGSHPRVRKHWQEFDTLTVDEASRVADAEFLIGGIRSRRWVLVGDEHQLPPYVEQADEHLVHALVALLMAERSATSGVAEAIDQLATWWDEDEELRQFRRESVTDRQMLQEVRR